jgi:hypothetical protein
MNLTSNKQLTDQLKLKIKNALKDVCLSAHSIHNKQMLKEMVDRVQMACPYCGDSHSDDTKKRGNLYWDTLQYHCYNCGHHTDLKALLTDHDIRLQNSQDSFDIIDYIQHNRSISSHQETLTHSIFQTAVELSITREQFKSHFRAKEIEPGEWIWFYLKGRLLHNRCNEFLFSPVDNRLWILNFTPDGKIIAAQSRRMKGKGSRYLTYDLAKLYEELGLTLQLEPAEVEGISKISTLFGIMQVNFQQKVTIFEGPIDAKFMHNSLALATAGRNTEEFDNMQTVRYLFDNDETGRTKMIEKLKRGRSVFMWSKFLKENKLDKYSIKDLNELVIKCFELKNPAIKKMDQYFTTNQLDLWYI